MLFAPMPHTMREVTARQSKYAALFSLGLRFADLIGLTAAGFLAYWLRFGAVEISLEYQRHIARGLLIALLVFSMSPLYRSWRGRGLASELWTMLGAYSTIFIVSVLYTAAFKMTSDISRLWWGTWFIGAVVAGTGSRFLCRGTAAWTRKAGLDLRTAVVVGVGADAEKIAESFEQHRGAGISFLGWFSTPSDEGRALSAPRLGGLDELASFVQANHVDQVWVTLPMSAQAEIARVMDCLAHSTADIKLVPDLFGLHLLNHSVENVAGLPVISLQQTPLQGGRYVLKSLEDRLLASLILLVISPLMLCIALAVKMSSPGPVFYRQERVSWNNRRFGMLKFRSMPVDAETKSGPTWAKAGELRATRVGSFLRKTSLDELPQFINVLKGEMSIVGPRPERPVFVDRFKHEVPAYMKKHMVKAGITGWAQVNGWRGDTDLKRRIECDLYYIENWSLSLDIKIILQTLYKGFVHKNAY